jgi:hypothetical protein
MDIVVVLLVDGVDEGLVDVGKDDSVALKWESVRVHR